MDTMCKISKRRKEDLERELNYLKTTRTREAEAMIAEAMMYGDLENNSEYDAAKSEQQKLQGRIAEIEKILSCADIIAEEVEEVEEKHLSEDFLSELRKRIKECGLSAKQAESYAQYCQIRFKLEEQERYGTLPADNCWETLKEAQRIVLGCERSYELNDYTIDGLLQISCDQWKLTKETIMKCFGCNEENIEELFNKDEEWLFVSPDSVNELAVYLKKTFSETSIAWKIFQRAGLLGVNISKSRIDAVLDMLGEEFGKKAICADAERNTWILYRYYTDPVGCIAYMKECGLTPEQILKIVQQDPDILYFYKEGRRLSYNHNQEYIDRIIRKYQ